MADDEYSTLHLRVRDAWGEYAAVICLVGLLMMAAGGWTAASVLAVGPLGGDDAPVGASETEERTIRLMEATGSFEHGATVKEDSRAFTQGERLSGRALYFSSVAPVLDGTHRYSYVADDGDLRVDSEARLVIREVDDEANYWSVTEPLESTGEQGVSPGETVETGFSVNVSAVDERADAIREELGAAPGSVESIVVVRTTYEGTVDGQPVSGSMTTELEIDSDGDVYRVNTEESTSVEERTETVAADEDVSPAEPIGAGLLIGLGLVAIVATLVGRVQGRFDLSPAEEHALVRTEFEEWITTARVPTDATDRPVVPVSSLEGLVDLAIDTDGRVIHDEVSGQYVLFDETFTYIFIPRYVAANTIGVTGGDSTTDPATVPEEVKHPRQKAAGPEETDADESDDRPTSRGEREDTPPAGASEEAFGGWIMTEPLAEDIGGGRTVPVSSLAELVGLAVDANRPVIRDEDSETYVLFGDDATYAFVPDEADGSNGGPSPEAAEDADSKPDDESPPAAVDEADTSENDDNAAEDDPE